MLLDLQMPGWEMAPYIGVGLSIFIVAVIFVVNVARGYREKK